MIVTADMRCSRVSRAFVSSMMDASRGRYQPTACRDSDSLRKKIDLSQQSNGKPLHSDSKSNSEVTVAVAIGTCSSSSKRREQCEFELTEV